MQKMMKRAFDLAVASIGTAWLSPLFLIVAVLIKLDSEGPVFFRQERVGKGFRPFRIYKFRTMVSDATRKGRLITSGADPRITRVGQFLRQTKLDELPQLINVLKGDMSVVGPRPEVQAYVEAFRNDFDEILTVRPGITDVASLQFRDEASILGAFRDPEAAYRTSILPAKINLSKEYIRQASLCSDLRVILRTVAAVLSIAPPETPGPTRNDFVE
jgi:lipopolysaccharide/colanic/teichoic acid biosynthesis glycosyltransferase